MAHSEDCSTVLEQFVHDVANLPAEINHLMEEIQAKDKIIQECRAIISSRDASLQKFIKLNGSHTLNPKEESYSNAIIQNMDRCQILQDEKIALSEKAAIILDRHVKKLDIKIRDLQNDGLLSSEPPIPSLFNLKDTHRDPTKSFLFAESAQADTYPSALNPTSGNAALPANLLQRLNSAAAAAAGVPGAGGLGGRNSAPATPAAAALHFQQRQRESSAGATENKRRKLNASLGNLPAAPSGLRQSSLGPGTPKPGTPGATRAGSAGPRAAAAAKKASIKKVAPHQQIRKIKAGATASKSSKRSSSNNGRLKAGSGNASRKKSPASAASVVEEEDESMLSSADLSDSENNASRRQAGRDSDEEMEDEEDETGEDTKVYCTCRSVSHGDMVACDNDNCPYEWFHWKCVGLTREPLGTWYCEECRRNLGK